MSTKVYEDFDSESFIINNIKLRVNPTDVTLFADNAIYSETYLRSKAVFSYRSKHSREKVILTLPISVSVTSASNDENALYSREDGLRLLSQLVNYPFCYIRSSRIKSYIAPLGGVSTTDFLMMGVQQLTLIQDMSIPDVLFVEVHLVFNNFSPLLKNFKFKDYTKVVEIPSQSDMFNEAFSELETNKKDVDTLLEQLKTLIGDELKSGSAYVDSSLPYGTTVILAPKISEIGENALNEGSIDYSTLTMETKEFEVTASDGSAATNLEFLSSVDSENGATPSVKKKFQVAWTAPSDLSFGGVSALQRVKITRYNRLARHFVSSHKHPILQYMGRQPATVELSYKINSSEVYKENVSSIIAAYTHLFNIIDFNSIVYPEATAYNTLKIRSIGAQALGVTNLVPNQKHISSSSNEQGIEVLNITLIESSIEEFMQISRPVLGRTALGDSVANLYKEAVVLAYLDKLAVNTAIVTNNLYSSSSFRVYDSNYKNIYKIFFNSMSSAYDGIISEFTGGATGGRIVTSSGMVSNNFRLLAENYTDMPTILRDAKSLAIVLKSVITERNVYKNKTEKERMALASKLKTVEVDFGSEGVKTIKFAENFKKAGLVDMQIGNMYTQISKMAELGDTAATLSMSANKSETSLINEARVTNYTGNNFKEFNLSLLKGEGGAASPMYFIEPYFHMNPSDMLAAYDMVDKSYKSSIDEVLTSQSDLFNSSVQSDYNFVSPILTPKEIEEYSYSAHEDGENRVDVLGNPITGGDYQGTQGGNYGLIGGSGGTDWNAATGLTAVQQKAIVSIKEGVAKSSLIAEKDKKNWTVFLIQVAGVESGLGLGIKSHSGALGLFQITGKTAKGLGYTSDQVLNNFPIATEAAIKYFTGPIKTVTTRNGWSKWVDLFLCYNLGVGGGESFLKANYNGSELTKGDIGRIETQKVANINGSSIPDKRKLTKAYYNHIVNKFHPMNVHMNAEGKKNAASADRGIEIKPEEAVKNEKITNASKEDIAKDFVKVSYKAKPSEVVLAHSFFVTYNGKEYKIQIKGITTPYPEIPNRKLVLKNYNNRTLIYIRNSQPFGASAMQQMIKTVTGGFYVERKALVEGAVGQTVAYNLNYKDIAGIMVELGLAMPVQGTVYAKLPPSRFNMKANAQKDPASYDADYKAMAVKFANGDTKIRFQDFAKSGYFQDTKEDFVKILTDKVDTSSYRQVPSVTTNKYLPFSNGTGTVTSVYGVWRPSSKRYHLGIDSVNNGSGITQHAAADGIVVQKGYSGAAGNRIRIWHNKIGFSTQYFHLKDFNVNQGDKVVAGQSIGTMGNTGASRGAHSHYQVGFGNTAKGALINPWMTTLLSSIPSYNGSTALGLQSHATMYLNKNFFLSGENVDLRKSDGVYKGGSVTTDNFPVDGDRDYAKALSEVSIRKAVSSAKSRKIPYDKSVFNEKEIASRQISNMLYPFAQGMDTAFPVLKAYITVGTDNEDLILNDQVRLSYYYELDGISSFVVNCNNDENPVDTVVMSIANPSFTVSDNYAVTGKYLTTDVTRLYGAEEVEWVADRIKIKSGTKLHIRAGYGNNPNDLATIFNGVVTNVTGEKSATLNLVCEGFGRELLSVQMNPTKPEAAGGEWYNSSTSLIYSKSLLQDGIVHFGTKSNFLNQALAWMTPFGDSIEEDDKSDPEAKRLVTRFGINPFGNFGIHFTGGNLKQRMFTNIYAAEIDVLHPEFASRLSTYFANLLSLTEKSGYFYIFEGQTPWEAMKEMEYRHPGTLAKPLFYEDRMTMFFGLKEQMYIARDLDSGFMGAVASDKADTLTAEYLDQRNKRFDLVTRFHVATSANNIISNSLALNSSFSTGVDVLYFEDDDDRIDKDPNGLDSFKMTLDDDLNYWEYRYKTVSLPGTHGKYSSFMYGTTELRKQAEQMYGGKILLIGNPQIKAGDFIFIDDDTKKMTGIVKIRECMHHYSENGFITEITPGLYIEASNFYYTTLFTKLGLTAQAAISLSNFSTEITALSNDDFNVFYKTFIESTNNSILSNITNTASAVLYNAGATPIAAAALGSIVMYNSLRSLHSLGIKSKNTYAAYVFGKKAYSLVASVADTGYKSLSSTMGFFKKTKTGIKATESLNNLVKSSTLVRGVVGTVKGVTWTASRMLTLVGKLRRASSILLMVGSRHPIGFLISVIGTFIFKYIEGLIQESMLTRQPLILFPINYFGRPYVAGISGYTINSWLESKKSNFDKNMKYVSKFAQERRLVQPDSALASILGFFSNASSKSYNTGLITGLKTSEPNSMDLGKK